MILKDKTNLSIFALAMLITVSIDSIRNLPATALFGPALIFFFIAASIGFLVPTALVSAELSSTWIEEGGIYHWVRMASNDHFAFFAVWLQWINTMVWFPTILSFIAGTAAFLFDPTLAQNKFYLVTVILSVFWLLTILNLRGLRASAKFATFCAVLGMIVPMALIIILFFIWFISGQPLEIHITADNILPDFRHLQSWISITAIVSAFLGMELATVHVRNILGAPRKFPQALFLSVIIIAITMLMGSLAIAFVLPSSQINLVDGVMQAFVNYFVAYRLSFLLPVIAVLLLLGSIGGMINWIISPAKGLMHAAERGYLPDYFQQENRYGVPGHLLVTQAVIVTIICMAFLFMPTVNSSYWLLTDLSTELYMVMYILMFLSALIIHYKFKHQAKLFVIPGGALGKWLTCIIGMLACIVTIIIGFFAPETIEAGAPWPSYSVLFSAGLILMLLPALFFYGYRILRK